MNIVVENWEQILNKMTNIAHLIFHTIRGLRRLLYMKLPMTLSIFS